MSESTESFLSIVGSFGNRGPSSDYGDHPGGRRVSGSLYGDSGDDASETSSICSERAFEVGELEIPENDTKTNSSTGYRRYFTSFG